MLASLAESNLISLPEGPPFCLCLALKQPLHAYQPQLVPELGQWPQGSTMEHQWAYVSFCIALSSLYQPT